MTTDRTYTATHPWIRFSADFSEASPSFWLILGECASKCDRLSRVPLRPSTAEDLHKIYLAKGVQATVAIEGNTLSEEEVRKQVEGNLEVPPSKQYLKQEVQNVIQACNTIKRTVDTGMKLRLDAGRVQELNSIVLTDLEVAEHISPGRLRNVSVGVGTVYRGAPAEDCEFLLEQLCEWLDGDDFRPPEQMQQHSVAFAILKSIMAHLYLAWIHPFGDGNGRTARLVEFQILIMSGVPAPAAQLLSNHYNATRAEYYRQLDRASKSGGEILPFVEYALQGLLDGLRNQLEYVWDQQYDVTWRNFVHERFRDRRGAVSDRQRNLILDLSREVEPVPKHKLTELSPRLARAYANRNVRTLSRDINVLREMELIDETAEGLRARKHVILSFLPTSANLSSGMASDSIG